jgi:hypothetical protein
MTTFVAAILALILSPWGQSSVGPAGAVTGQLLLRDGTPAVGVRVGALSASDSGVTQPLVSIVVTDELGRYRMTLPAGRYYIQVGRVVGPTYYPGTPTLAAASVVSVASGSESTVPAFRMSQVWEAKVSGRVTGARPEELAGATVQLLSLPGPGILSRPSLSASLTGDGTFEFSGAMPGSVYFASIRISNPGSVSITPVVVDADDVSGVALRLLRTREVHGKVIVEGGGVAPEGIKIDAGSIADASWDQNRMMAESLQRTSAGRRTIVLTGESTFELGLAEGDHKISVSRLPEGFTVTSILYGSVDLTREPLRLSGAQALEEIRITIAPK